MMNDILRDASGHLTISGMRADELAAQYGTPLYVYSGEGFVRSFTTFTKSLSEVDARVHYAVKANSAIGILSLLASCGAGADIVSGGEMRRALAAGIPADKIVFSGVGKTDDEIRAALGEGVGQINAESAAEIAHISAIANAMNLQAPVALRVNVNVDPGSHKKISTGQRSTKFGIPVEDGEAAHLYREICANPHIIPRGLAVHIGSQLRNLAPFEMAYQALLEIADSLRAEGLDVPILDLGGGLGIDYEGDSDPNFAAYGALVTRIFANRGYQLGFEPGRCIAADNGVLLVTNLYTKQGEDKRFIITDGAMNDLIRPTLYESYHRIEPVGPQQTATGIADIVGPVCETGDYLGTDRMMPDVPEGSCLAVMSAGAYGAVMMSNYNTRPEAAEIIIYQGQAHILRPRRTVDDLIALEDNPF
jgi:diaminopimelate decarboxylase